MAAPERWFEDFTPGLVSEFGDHEITEQEIIDFARRYDPQPFHTDPEAAKRSSFGGLIASGWNTVGVLMRMLVDHQVPANASLGSPGIDEIRWLKPVRPGDRLRARVTVQEATRSRSKPDRGVVRSLNEVLNQHGEVVMTMRGMMLLRARDVA
ncbi:MAG: acyl dehydratase [Rhodospirillales bacterium 70-18]|nr:MAG: acyl dehydratase [Rhodospirillales bacterium 70-18]